MRKGLTLLFLFFWLSEGHSSATPSLVQFQLQQCKSNKKCFRIVAPKANLSVAGTTITAEKSLLSIYRNASDQHPTQYRCDSLTLWSQSQNILCDNRPSKIEPTLVFDDHLLAIQYN